MSCPCKWLQDDFSFSVVKLSILELISRKVSPDKEQLTIEGKSFTPRQSDNEISLAGSFNEGQTPCAVDIELSSQLLIA